MWKGADANACHLLRRWAERMSTRATATALDRICLHISGSTVRKLARLVPEVCLEASTANVALAALQLLARIVLSGKFAIYIDLFANVDYTEHNFLEASA